MYDRQYFLKLLTSFIRFALAGVGTWFTSKGIGSEDEWGFAVAGIALLVVNAISILWAKYGDRLEFLAAKNSSPTTLDSVIVAQAAERAESPQAAANLDRKS